MEVANPDELEAGARAHDHRVANVASILAGQYQVPNYAMALPPRDYQRTAAALVWNNDGVLVADELGLGKTICGLTVLSNPECLPAVVVCPTHLQRQWAKETKRFLPGLRVHIVKKRAEYDLGDQDVLVTTYHKLTDWAPRLAGKARTVIYDEVQELRRPESQKYDGAAAMSASANFRVGLSATPIYNYGGEFFAVLDVLAPGRLGAKSEFIEQWCDYSWDERKTKIKNPKAFGSYIREAGLMIRRTKAEVGRELPDLNIISHEIEADPARLKAIEGNATRLANIIVSETKQKGWDILKASQEFTNALRQATGVAKAPYVADFVRLLIEESDEPVVLFGWHREVYGIWMEQLADLKPRLYTGSESPNQKAQAAEDFIRGRSKLLIVSLRSGAGLDGLQQVCSRAVLGELDWAPGVHEQCIGRVHRDGQASPVFAYYLIANEGSDPFVSDALGLKKQQLEGVRRNTGEVVAQTRVDPDHVRKLAKAYLEGRL